MLCTTMLCCTRTDDQQVLQKHTWVQKIQFSILRVASSIFHVNYNYLAFQLFRKAPHNLFDNTYLRTYIFNMSTEIELVPFHILQHIVDKPPP